MAVRNVPPANSYNAPGTSTGRRERSFAALYEQARQAAANDAGQQDNSDNASQNAAQNLAAQNRKYIQNLHERVDTLRGEIIVRVIQSGQAQDAEAFSKTGEITRLSDRLDTLRRKLETEEVRLSGTLIDVKV